jgi:hypothetical protein
MSLWYTEANDLNDEKGLVHAIVVWLPFFGLRCDIVAPLMVTAGLRESWWGADPRGIEPGWSSAPQKKLRV